MSKQDLARLANSEPLNIIRRPYGDREYLLREFTYGVLVPDSTHPLSCVSVANSSLSIDIWVGCKWQCAYCQVQGSSQDLADSGAMPSRPQRRTLHTIDQIVDAVTEHPFFERNETVISIGTASTEPLAPGLVVESTFDIMEKFMNRGFLNPFWIVTKRGMPRKYAHRLQRIVAATKGVMISICWADNPVNVEPIANNRFLDADAAKAAGAVLTWYMRPLSPEWSGTDKGIERMMIWVKERYGHLLSAIVPGGLRWSEGIEGAMTEVHHVPLPKASRNDNEKDLPYELAAQIVKLAEIHFPDIPVYFKASCAITHMLRRPSISAVQRLSRKECEMSRCPSKQRQLCADSPHSLGKEKLQGLLDRLGVEATASDWNGVGMPVTEPDLSKFTYAIRQTVINNLGRV